jgi:hypothetical protein
VSVGVLRDTINQFDLVDVWRSKHPNTRQYTWVKVFGARVSAARLDHLYMSRNQSNRLFSILPVGFSDHQITMALRSISPRPRQESYWKSYWKLMYSSYKVPLFAQVSRPFGKGGGSKERSMSL